MLKKTNTLFSTLILLALFIATAMTATIDIAYGSQVPYVTMTKATEEANKLNSLGLLAGDGKGNYNLDKVPTRAEGLVMLIRMMGEETAAKNCTYKNPFNDVPSWADRYTAWAYAKKYTSGTSATTFSPNDKITAVQYLTFMLRALGYGGETTLQNAVAKATEVGLIPANTYVDATVPFLRADMVHISYFALQTKENTTGTPLYSVLIAKEAIDETKAITMFKPDTTSIGEPPLTNGDILDYLGYAPNDKSGSGQSNTPEKLYSITNTNNSKSSYTVSIDGNQVTITGIEKIGVNYISLCLYEVKTVAAAGRMNVEQKVLYKDIINPATRFSDSITIPALQYGNYFELVVKAQNDVGSVNVMEKIWIKGTTNAWYFEGPTKITSNTTLMQAANNVPMDDWFKLRTNVTDNFKEEVFDLMGPPAGSDYETAYNVQTWIAKNISYTIKAEADSLWVLENRIATCEGYANLMADALSAYGIPSRVVVGETLFGDALVDSFTSPSYANHAWVEFYDSATSNWIVCDPTMGAKVPSFFFDMNRNYAANGMKAVRYK